MTDRLRERELRESLQPFPVLVGLLSIFSSLGFLVAGLFILRRTGSPALDALLWGVYGGGTVGSVLILRRVLLRRWERRQREKVVARLRRLT